MSDPFIGEIQIYGFNFAPYNWAMCQGQLMPIQQNTALFSLLGTQFGGNGTSNFQLPNYTGNAACGQGAGPGVTTRTVGETFGSDNITLLLNQMPAHTHGARIYNQPTTANRSGIPASGDAIITPESVTILATTTTTNTTFPVQTIGITGNSLPHENQQPYLTLNFCISLSGTFPQRP
ncbi:Microcystin-dependent protein [Dyella sp. OK004]|uniref:phage tail protein n=1 Tax=Dyella sp. OK004 TaxID=1855292 RepID=UPI0008EF21D4|nr:tail fiber protein [Dyella sp. OK004]SFR94977.1 Microcystin-dependent protein [Dyella sp. OK004]